MAAYAGLKAVAVGLLSLRLVTSADVISRVAVLPQPPLLVPELMGTSVRSSESMRQACLLAAHRLADASGNWVGVGPGEMTETIVPSARGSFRGYGADVNVTLDDRTDAHSAASSEGSRRSLPLCALVGAWLREHSGASAVRIEVVPEVPSAVSPPRCRPQDLPVLERLLDTDEEVGLLVLGDGSNRRGRGSPGAHDERAEAFDERVAEALGRADTAQLAGLDPELAERLGVSGWTPWQVLAHAAGGGAWRGELLYTGAPFGVGYHVAVWERV